MGLLLILNVALILGIFTAFWIEIKLIPILWLLAFISPITFLIINKALISADCEIGEFKLQEKQDKKKKD